MSSIHVVYGPVAAGKSTFAIELSDDLGAVRLNVDEWYSNLFSSDFTPEMMAKFSTDKAIQEWPRARYKRCDNQIWEVAKEVLRRGKDVVLELALDTASYRNEFRRSFQESGYPYTFYYVTAPRSVRLARLRERNAAKGETYVAEVTEAAFDFVDSAIEPPGDEELAGSTVIDTTP